ncbi:hypothetical protein JL108_10925 [Aeromicrobium sp. YIM 150415]|uniref:sensor histidine kinase n=1 Tax=Aeromicrobium sp. YIM 150415 TaxID=2803912 RepID=UPI00196527D3|nr:histidine kinase [Aeromicrobium sp. YIM 150415]MBM9463960.1 hypothetical protein [Aeromicrobium sp. YIM 150415]
MRRVAPEEWSGFVMLVVCAGVSLPVIIGWNTTSIPYLLWVALFAVAFVALLAAVLTTPFVGRIAYGVAVVAGWLLLLSVDHTGLVPIVLVMVAASGPGLVSGRTTATIIVANTAVIGFAVSRTDDRWENTVISAGFYLLIQIASYLSVAAIMREQRLRGELSEAHVELQAQSVLLEETSRSAERLRISRDLHDLIGHQLTVLTLELEAARHREGAEAREHVERADRVARDLLANVRSTVGELRDRPIDLASALKQVGKDAPGLDVDVVVADGVCLDERQTEALVRTMQEIVTNTLRHARAENLTVDVRRADDLLLLTAVDDGIGSAGVRPGNGLSGLTERLAALGGSVEFDGASGFRVEARVPVR